MTAFVICVGSSLLSITRGCDISTQLTYIQKIIQFNKGAISTIKVLQSNTFKMH